MRNIIYTFEDVVFGSETEAENGLKELSKDEKIDYLKQIFEGLIFKRPQFKNFNTKEMAENVVENSTDEDYFNFVKKLNKYLSFYSNKNATDRLVDAFSGIIFSDKPCSLKSSYASFYEYKYELTDIISTDISQTYKMLITHSFLLVQQLFTKLCDQQNFVTDDRFIKTMDSIRKSTGKLADVKNKDIVRIIRNGIAHFSFADNSTTTQCLDLEALKKNMRIKISSKDGEEFIVLDGTYITILTGLMSYYLSEAMHTLNIPKDYYMASDSDKRKIMLEKFNDLLNYGNLEPFQKEYIRFCQQFDIEAMLKGNSYTRIKTTLEYPQVNMLEHLYDIRQILEKLNSSRNKTITNKTDISDSMPVLGLTFLFNAVSHLVDLKLVKSYVEENYDGDLLKKVRLFKMDTNPKKKSVVNKLRLLRNCLAHSYVLLAADGFSLYDVDENNIKIDLGHIDIGEIFNLCESIENHIVKYYDNLLLKCSSKTDVINEENELDITKT